MFSSTRNVLVIVWISCLFYICVNIQKYLKNLKAYGDICLHILSSCVVQLLQLRQDHWHDGREAGRSGQPASLSEVIVLPQNSPF
jgi:hypothetical protein